VAKRPDHPSYPELRVSTRSPNPLALVAAVREELRLAGAGDEAIERFTSQALADPRDAGSVLEVAEEWVGAVDAPIARF
jgi:hypothetical protein